jgi:peptidoglycan/xylan/chitin deacetylase (PgdA/CDA1 family)
MRLPVVAFFYHTVSDSPLPHVAPLYPVKSTAQFEQDLAYLKRNFNIVGHDDLVAAFEHGKSLPPRAATVSFDDGLAGCFSMVRPLLLKHGVPCTFFLIRDVVGNRALMSRNKAALCLSRLQEPQVDADAAVAAVGRACGRRLSTQGALRRWVWSLGYDDDDAIDRVCEALAVDVDAFLQASRPYMTTDEILKLHAEGFTIGAHSVSHPQLARLPWERARAQIVDSAKSVRSLTGKARVPFAFPFNGIDLPRRRLADLRSEAGSIDLMYDTNNLMNDADFIVNRICSDTPARAAVRQSNLPAVLFRARALEPVRAAKRWLAGRPH